MTSHTKDRSNIYNPLPNLGSIIVRSKHSSPTLIFSKNYPAFLLHSLLNFCFKLSSVLDTKAMQQNFYSLIFNEDMKSFINNVIAHSASYRQQINWFGKIEIMLLHVIIAINAENSHQNLIISKSTVLKLTLQLLTFLTQEMTISIISLLDDVVFNVDYYEDRTQSQLNQWRKIYVDAIVSSLKINKVQLVFNYRPTFNDDIFRYF